MDGSLSINASLSSSLSAIPSLSDAKAGDPRADFKVKGKQRDAAASHDSSEESMSNSPESSTGQRHASTMVPKVKAREERLPLLQSGSPVQKHSALPELQKFASKKRSSQGDAKTPASLTAKVDTAPQVTERVSSLESRKTSSSKTKSPVVVDGSQQIDSSLPSKQGNGQIHVPSHLIKYQDEMRISMRNFALDKTTSVDTMKHIRDLYRRTDLKDVVDKEEIILGKIKPISAAGLSVAENMEYLERVWDLYKLNEDVVVVKRMEKQIIALKSLKNADQILEAGHLLVEWMLFRLTPNQRILLKQDFSLLYWKSTVKDDINRLFFDTIMMSLKEEDRKKKLLALYETPEKDRERIRDKIMEKAHGQMTATQRDQLKKICKARYDKLINSRLPTLHVIIREQDEAGMVEYIDNVLHYAPPDQRVRLLQARCDTAKGKETGDASFFALAHSGNPEMMATYLSIILKTKKLTPPQKWDVLRSVRFEDGICAFHLMMSSGDWARVKRFVEEIFTYQCYREDYFDVKTDIEYTVQYTSLKKFPDFKMIDVLGGLLEAPVADEKRLYFWRSAHTSAMEAGHKKCAKNFRKIVTNDINKKYLFNADVLGMTNEQPYNASNLTWAEHNAKRQKAIYDGPLFKIRDSMKIEMMPPEARDEEIRAYARSEARLKAQMRKTEEEYPWLLTVKEENIARDYRRQVATNQYQKVYIDNLAMRSQRINKNGRPLTGKASVSGYIKWRWSLDKDEPSLPWTIKSQWPNKLKSAKPYPVKPPIRTLPKWRSTEDVAKLKKASPIRPPSPSSRIAQFKKLNSPSSPGLQSSPAIRSSPLMPAVPSSFSSPYKGDKKTKGYNGDEENLIEVSEGT